MINYDWDAFNSNRLINITYREYFTISSTIVSEKPDWTYGSMQLVTLRVEQSHNWMIHGSGLTPGL